MWGIGANHQRIYVSSLPIDENFVDSSNVYIFNGLQSTFYKVADDSLLIYTLKKVKEPINFKIEINVIQFEIDNPEYIRLLENYDEIGLKIL